MKLWAVVVLLMFIAFTCWPFSDARQTYHRRKYAESKAQSRLLLHRMLYQIGFGVTACLAGVAYAVYIVS